MPDNRIDNTTVANAETNARLAPVSPTGTPLIPPKAVPWLTLVAGLAGILAALPAFGVALPPVVVGISTAVVAILAGLGIASPGLRK